MAAPELCMPRHFARQLNFNQVHTIERLAVGFLSIAMGQAPTPFKLAVEGPPASGKSFFSRALVATINSPDQRRPAAQIYKSDYHLLGTSRRINDEAAEALAWDAVASIEFWYDFKGFQNALRILSALEPGQEHEFAGLYRAGESNYCQTINLQLKGPNILVIEGCYAMHRDHHQFIDQGLFFRNDFRPIAFIRRFKERRPGMSWPTLYDLTSTCYHNYLVTGKIDLGKLRWLVKSINFMYDIKNYTHGLRLPDFLEIMGVPAKPIKFSWIDLFFR